MRLLIVTSSSYDSVTRGIYKQIIDHIAKKFDKVTVLCNGSYLKNKSHNVTYVRGNILQLLRIANNDSFDQVLISDFFVAGLFGVIYGRLKHTPVVLRCGSPWRYVIDSPSKLLKTILVNIIKPIVIKNCSKVIYNSKSIIQPYSHKHVVVYNGVDTKLFKPSKTKPSKKLRVLFVGRVHTEKGLEYLFNAVSSIQDQVSLSIVGTGPQLETYKKRHAFAKYYGLIKHTKLPKIINQHDIVILPTIRNSSESFPNALLEAMACGKPVMGTNVWGIPELIKHNKTGIIIPEKDPIAIKNALLKFGNKTFRNHLGINARKDVMSNFESKQQTEKFYKELTHS
jgi:teichuronic acid biosynthesis glycosyltransferase TuaC